MKLAALYVTLGALGQHLIYHIAPGPYVKRITQSKVVWDISLSRLGPNVRSGSN